MSKVLESKTNYLRSKKSFFSGNKKNLYKKAIYLNNVNKATLAAKIQIKEEQRELTYSTIALVMKFGLFIILLGSFFKLGISSHVRFLQNLDVSSDLNLETKKLEKMNLYFDSLFTIDGQERLLDKQDHLIAPNSFRVVWK